MHSYNLNKPSQVPRTLLLDRLDALLLIKPQAAEMYQAMQM
jgi:hypothetical protein